MEGPGEAVNDWTLTLDLLDEAISTLSATLDEAEDQVEKHMTDAPRRISALPVVFAMPAGLSVEQRRKLEAAAMTCPVKRSLHPDVDVHTRRQCRWERDGARSKPLRPGDAVAVGVRCDRCVDEIRVG